MGRRHAGDTIRHHLLKPAGGGVDSYGGVPRHKAVSCDEQRRPAAGAPGARGEGGLREAAQGGRPQRQAFTGDHHLQGAVTDGHRAHGEGDAVVRHGRGLQPHVPREDLHVVQTAPEPGARDGHRGGVAANGIRGEARDLGVEFGGVLEVAARGTGARNSSHVDLRLPSAHWGGGGVTGNRGVVHWPDPAGHSGYGQRRLRVCRKPRALDSEPSVSRSTASLGTKGVDDRQNHKAPIKLFGRDVDGRADVFDLNRDRMTDAHFQATVQWKTTVYLGLGAVDHMTGTPPNCNLFKTELDFITMRNISPIKHTDGMTIQMETYQNVKANKWIKNTIYKIFTFISCTVDERGSQFHWYSWIILRT